MGTCISSFCCLDSFAVLTISDIDLIPYFQDSFGMGYSTNAIFSIDRVFNTSYKSSEKCLNHKLQTLVASRISVPSDLDAGRIQTTKKNLEFDIAMFVLDVPKQYQGVVDTKKWLDKWIKSQFFEDPRKSSNVRQFEADFASAIYAKVLKFSFKTLRS